MGRAGWSGDLLGGFEGDLIAEGFEAFDGALSDAVGVAAVEVLGAEVLVAGAAFEEMVGDDEDGVADGDDGALPPASGGQAAGLLGQVAALAAAGGPGGLGEGGLEPGAPLAGLGASAFAPAGVVARAHAGPGGGVAVGGEAAHVDPELGDDDLGGAG